jgi:hypothetical protein
LSRTGSAWIGSNDGLAELCVIARKHTPSQQL